MVEPWKTETPPPLRERERVPVHDHSSDQAVGFCAPEADFYFAGVSLEVFLEALVFWCWLVAERVECSEGDG